MHDCSSWLLIGDFSSILSIEDHSDQVGLSAIDSEFSHYVDSIEVTDCSFSGPLFTWSSKQVNGYIVKKLDRKMVNMDFMSVFPSSHTRFTGLGFSDHCASITQFGLSSSRSPSPFVFFNFLTKNCKFLHVVAEVWNFVSFYGCKLYVLSKKLKDLKLALRKLNRECYSNIHIKLEV